MFFTRSYKRLKCCFFDRARILVNIRVYCMSHRRRNEQTFPEISFESYSYNLRYFCDVFHPVYNISNLLHLDRRKSALESFVCLRAPQHRTLRILTRYCATAQLDLEPAGMGATLNKGLTAGPAIRPSPAITRLTARKTAAAQGPRAPARLSCPGAAPAPRRGWSGTTPASPSPHRRSAR